MNDYLQRISLLAVTAVIAGLGLSGCSHESRVLVGRDLEPAGNVATTEVVTNVCRSMMLNALWWEATDEAVSLATDAAKTNPDLDSFAEAIRQIQIYSAQPATSENLDSLLTWRGAVEPVCESVLDNFPDTD